MRSELMKDFDEAWLKYNTVREIANNLLKDGVPIDVIARNTKLSEKEIREL